MVKALFGASVILEYNMREVSTLLFQMPIVVRIKNGSEKYLIAKNKPSPMPPLGFNNRHKDMDLIVTVVVAVRNEEEHLAKCLQSLVEQNFPCNLFRIAVVDGMSSDLTINVAESFRERYPELIRIYSNPGLWQSVGRNIAIRNCDNDFIAYLDGHCIADINWLKRLYEEIRMGDHDLAGVGSLHISPEEDSLIGQAIDAVFASYLGGLGSSYRRITSRREIPTASFVLYRREALVKVGLYDEDLRVGEDFALNYKLRNAGYRLLIQPEALVYYYKRRTAGAFFKQLFNYGMAKAVIGRKYPGSLGLQHFIPAIFLFAFLISCILGIFSTYFLLAAFTMLLIFISAIFLTALYFAFAWKKPALFILMPVIYLLEYSAYSSGFIFGLYKKGWKR